MNALATIQQSPVALADMTIPQLADAGKALDHAGDLYENTAGICRVLHGLVLLEAKRKLEHGKFMPWVEKEFPRSHREAGRRIRSAEDFMDSLGDKRRAKKLKLDTRVQFDPHQILLGDLATNLTEISAAQLDMSNPLAQAVSAYVDGRSWRQLLLDLGPSPSGGDRSASRQIRDLDEEIEFQKLKAKDQFQNLLVNMEEFFLSKRGKRFELLGDADRQIILGLLIDINKANRK